VLLSNSLSFNKQFPFIAGGAVFYRLITASVFARAPFWVSCFRKQPIVFSAKFWFKAVTTF